MRDEVLEYNKEREAAMDKLAKLARKWRAESIGHTPGHKVRRHGQIESRAGLWYLIAGGVKHPASPAQARKLEAVAGKFIRR